MSMSLLGITAELLDRLKVKNAPDLPDKKWRTWRSCVLKAANIKQRFVELKRQEIRVASFKSTHGALELLLHPQQLEWRFFANAYKEEPAILFLPPASLIDIVFGSARMYLLLVADLSLPPRKAALDHNKA